MTSEVLLGVLIGTVSFSGSTIAFAKLQELMTGRPVTYPAQQIINALIGLVALALIVTILITGSAALLWVLSSWPSCSVSLLSCPLAVPTCRC